MENFKKLFVSLLIVAAASLGMIACQNPRQSPSVEQPSGEQPAGEQSSDEQSTSEHPTSEHPQ